MQLVFKHLKTSKVSNRSISKDDLRIRNMRSLIFLPLSVSFVAGSFRSMQNCETQQRQIMERDLICDMPRGGELHLWAELINAFGIWIGTSPWALDSKHSISLQECCCVQINGLSCMPSLFIPVHQLIEIPRSEEVLWLRHYYAGTAWSGCRSALRVPICTG